MITFKTIWNKLISGLTKTADIISQIDPMNRIQMGHPIYQRMFNDFFQTLKVPETTEIESKTIIRKKINDPVTGITVRFEPDDFSIRIKYHDTDIIRFLPNEVDLDNGGWYTKYTAIMMNRFLSYAGIPLVVQHKSRRYHRPTAYELGYMPTAEERMQLHQEQEAANSVLYVKSSDDKYYRMDDHIVVATYDGLVTNLTPWEGRLLAGEGSLKFADSKYDRKRQLIDQLQLLRKKNQQDTAGYQELKKEFEKLKDVSPTKTADILNQLRPIIKWEDLPKMIRPYQVWKSHLGSLQYLYIGEHPQITKYIKDYYFDISDSTWELSLHNNFQDDQMGNVRVHKNEEPYELVLNDYRKSKTADIIQNIEPKDYDEYLQEIADQYPEYVHPPESEDIEENENPPPQTVSQENYPSMTPQQMLDAHKKHVESFQKFVARKKHEVDRDNKITAEFETEISRYAHRHGWELLEDNDEWENPKIIYAKKFADGVHLVQVEGWLDTGTPLYQHGVEEILYASYGWTVPWDDIFINEAMLEELMEERGYTEFDEIDPMEYISWDLMENYYHPDYYNETGETAYRNMLKKMHYDDEHVRPFNEHEFYAPAHWPHPRPKPDPSQYRMIDYEGQTLPQPQTEKELRPHLYTGLTFEFMKQADIIGQPSMQEKSEMPPQSEQPASILSTLVYFDGGDRMLGWYNNRVVKQIHAVAIQEGHVGYLKSQYRSSGPDVIVYFKAQPDAAEIQLRRTNGLVGARWYALPVEPLINPVASLKFADIISQLSTYKVGDRILLDVEQAAKHWPLPWHVWFLAGIPATIKKIYERGQAQYTRTLNSWRKSSGTPWLQIPDEGFLYVVEFDASKRVIGGSWNTQILSPSEIMPYNESLIQDQIDKAQKIYDKFPPHFASLKFGDIIDSFRELGQDPITPTSKRTLLVAPMDVGNSEWGVWWLNTTDEVDTFVSSFNNQPDAENFASDLAFRHGTSWSYSDTPPIDAGGEVVREPLENVPPPVQDMADEATRQHERGETIEMGWDEIPRQPPEIWIPLADAYAQMQVNDVWMVRRTDINDEGQPWTIKRNESTALGRKLSVKIGDVTYSLTPPKQHEEIYEARKVGESTPTQEAVASLKFGEDMNTQADWIGYLSAQVLDVERFWQYARENQVWSFQRAGQAQLQGQYINRFVKITSLNPELGQVHGIFGNSLEESMSPDKDVSTGFPTEDGWTQIRFVQVVQQPKEEK